MARIPAFLSTASACVTSVASISTTPRSLRIPPRRAEKMLELCRSSCAVRTLLSTKPLTCGGSRKIRISHLAFAVICAKSGVILGANYKSALETGACYRRNKLAHSEMPARHCIPKPARRHCQTSLGFPSRLSYRARLSLAGGSRCDWHACGRFLLIADRGAELAIVVDLEPRRPVAGYSHAGVSMAELFIADRPAAGIGIAQIIRPRKVLASRPPYIARDSRPQSPSHSSQDCDGQRSRLASFPVCRNFKDPAVDHVDVETPVRTHAKTRDLLFAQEAVNRGRMHAQILRQLSYRQKRRRGGCNAGLF